MHAHALLEQASGIEIRLWRFVSSYLLLLCELDLVDDDDNKVRVTELVLLMKGHRCGSDSACCRTAWKDFCLAHHCRWNGAADRDVCFCQGFGSSSTACVQAVRGRRVCGEQAGKRKGLKREKDDFHFNVFFLEAKEKNK